MVFTKVEFTSELRDWLEKEGRRYYPRLLKYVRITLVEAGNAVLAVFDETLQKEALTRLTERETDLVKDGFIEKEMTTVILRAGVKEVREIFFILIYVYNCIPNRKVTLKYNIQNSLSLSLSLFISFSFHTRPLTHSHICTHIHTYIHTL